MRFYPEDKLPALFTSYTPCRKEGGRCREKIPRGMIRQHQFDRVEMVALSKPIESEEIFSMMVQKHQIF